MTLVMAWVRQQKAKGLSKQQGLTPVTPSHSGVRRGKSGVQAEAPHSALLMSANAKIAARLGGAQQNVTGGAVLRQVLARIGLIEIARPFELARTGEAVSHVAHGRQLDPRLRCRFPDVLIAAYLDGVLTFGRNQRDVKRLGHAYRIMRKGARVPHPWRFLPRVGKFLC
jgi:hypothetical protein